MKQIWFAMLLMSLVSFFTMFDAKSQNKIHDALVSIQKDVQDVQIDKTTIKQNIDILDEAKGKLSFISVLVDEKGKSSKESFEFYVSDIDKNTIIRKTSGKKLYTSLSVNNNQKFIKHFKEDKLDSYTNNLEILFSNTDVAQQFGDIVKSTIPLVSSNQQAWNTNLDALNWLKNNLTKVNSGSASVDQTFDFGKGKDNLVVFTVKRSDSKGISTEEKYEFSILDINTKNLTVKINGTQLSVNIETKSDDRFIKYSKNNELQSFTNSFDMVASDIDQARTIISACAAAIDKSKQVFPDFGSLQKSIDYITKGTGDITLDKKSMTQKIGFTPGNGTKTVFTYAEPDSKGKLIEERYELYLNDMDVNSVNFKVNGKKITLICLSKTKTKFIKYFKDNALQDFQNEIDILTTDVESSREMVEAFKSAIKNSEVAPLTWKNSNDALSTLSGMIKGETIGTDVYKLSFTSTNTEPLYIKYVQNKTDAKGVQVEQANEFYPYTVDAATVKITSSGKFLIVDALILNKKQFVKSEKDGKLQSFDNEIEIMAFDAKQAQNIAEALKYMAKNSKPTDIVWKDKQSAMNFIIAHVTDLKGEGKNMKQKIELTNNDPCKVSYTISTADDKGKTTDEIYEFSLTDLNSQMTDYKVSGKSVLVILSCKNKEKLVKAYKNGAQQAYGSDVEITESDVEVARNVAEAFKKVITFCGN